MGSKLCDLHRILSFDVKIILVHIWIVNSILAEYRIFLHCKNKILCNFNDPKMELKVSIVHYILSRETSLLGEFFGGKVAEKG